MNPQPAHQSTESATAPSDPFPCSLQYFKDSTTTDAGKWLKEQLKSVLLDSQHFLGKQGAAMSVVYLKRNFSIKNSNPHNTLLVTPGFEPEPLGPMVLEARQSTFEPMLCPPYMVQQG